MGTNRVIAMMGLPRSGKTTKARQISKELGAPIVSADAVRIAIHGHRWYAPCEELVWAHVKIMIKALFEAGHDTVIVDNTNTTQQARDHLRNWGQDEDGINFRVEFCEITTNPLVCTSRARVTDMPDLIPVINSMAENRQPLRPGERRWQS